MLFANSMRGDGDVVNEVPQNGQQQDRDNEGGVNDEDHGSEGEADEADGDQAGEEIAGQGIVVTSPTSGQSVSSPLMITDRAQGGWYLRHLPSTAFFFHGCTYCIGICNCTR